MGNLFNWGSANSSFDIATIIPCFQHHENVSRCGKKSELHSLDYSNDESIWLLLVRGCWNSLIVAQQTRMECLFWWRREGRTFLTMQQLLLLWNTIEEWWLPLMSASRQAHFHARTPLNQLCLIENLCVLGKHFSSKVINCVLESHHCWCTHVFQTALFVQRKEKYNNDEDDDTQNLQFLCRAMHWCNLSIQDGGNKILIPWASAIP